MRHKPHVVVIGAGFTGCATAHDLTLRGCDVTVIERGEIAAGASGKILGLLHSGARYCVIDPDTAITCYQETKTIQRIAAPAVQSYGGMFVALDDHDLAYADQFFSAAQACQIPVQELSHYDALRLEPHLTPYCQLVALVPDVLVDPLRLALAFAASARANGARFLTYHEVRRLQFNHQGDVIGVVAYDRASEAPLRIKADLVINATGAWTGRIVRLIQSQLTIRIVPGTVVSLDRRLTNHPIQRLNLPQEGDMVVPHRHHQLVGTTWAEAYDPDLTTIPPAEPQRLVQKGCDLVPDLTQAEIQAVFSANRCQIDAGDMAHSRRQFICYDHATADGVGNLLSVVGGKATMCRLMAETVGDLACARLGMDEPCRTRDIPLTSYRLYYAAA